MKPYTINYPVDKFERAIRARCRVAYILDYDKRQREIIKTIIDFQNIARLIELDRSADTMNAKISSLRSGILWLKSRIGLKLVCDVRRQTEYFYIPRAIIYDQFPV